MNTKQIPLLKDVYLMQPDDGGSPRPPRYYGWACYLETLKAGNVGLYEHFSFQLKEQVSIQLGNLTLYAMLRSGNK